MKFISHRGNIDGPIESLENDPKYIDRALSQGYDVEVDIWVIDDILLSGHDKPEYKIDLDWLLTRKNSLWIHTKNITALNYIHNLNQDINYFWHQQDDVVLTSKNFFWTYPGKELTTNSIAVLPELLHYDNMSIAYGICSDFISQYKKL